MQRIKHTLLTTTLFAILLGGFSLDAQAQRQADGFTRLAFSEAISGESTDLDGVLEVLTEHTVLKGKTSKAVRIVFVYGIGHGKEVFGLTISDPVQLVPETPAFTTLDGERLNSPWQAYDDPVFSYDDPVFSYDDPVFSYDDPVFSYDDPAQALAEIWGTNGRALPPDTYGLVLFTMPDPSSKESQATIRHSAAIVPFTVTENERSGN